ncbi:GDSL-type esterase/lipase family protein [Anaerotruncus colihominis]|uniref:GDSL-type esterase/lipase family protein n=1 Tax=Anaerotruncus colihominis TaxID=169435 RepID=UPI00189B3148|nr:GDSL-type esterase/lipase family protein [Anaerotruncus colihominis]
MYKEKPVKINRGDNPHHLLTVVILLAFAVVISLVIAIVWQKVSDRGADLSRYQTLSSVVSGTQTESDALESSSAAKSSSVPVPSEPEEQKLPVFDGAVPESERVMGDYFDDAVFVGDSITEGIMLYGMMSNTTVFAGTGVNLLTVYSAQTVKQEDGSRIPIMDALDAEQFAKVYVMLGGNEAREDVDTFISHYSKVIDDLKIKQPQAIIYIQSILPVTKNNNYNLDNTHIDAFNEALLTLCKEKEVYFVNVAECMKDENGMLPDEASPADGMHFGPDYYTKWFEYLKTHTVEQA